MNTQLHDLVARALYLTKAHSLPAVCERFGLEPGEENEAFSSKMQYVMRRLERLSDENVFMVAKSVVQDFPDDKLQAAIEIIEKEGRLVSDITRHILPKRWTSFHSPVRMISLTCSVSIGRRLIKRNLIVHSIRRWRTTFTAMQFKTTIGRTPKSTVRRISDLFPG